MEEAMTLLKSGGYVEGASGTCIENSEELTFTWYEDLMRNGFSRVMLMDFNGLYKEVQIHVETLLKLVELKGTDWKKLTKLQKWRPLPKNSNKMRTIVFGRIIK